MTMVNMAMSAEEAKEQGEVTLDSKYSYGLRIHLDDDALAKLGLTTMPAVGSKLTITCAVEVCSMSSYQDQGGEAESSLDLQITDMEVGEGKDAQTDTQAASMLYPS